MAPPDGLVAAEHQRPVTSVTVNDTSAPPLAGSISRLDADMQHRLSGSAERGFVDTMTRTESAPRTGSRSVPPEMFRAWLLDAHKGFALQASRIVDNQIIVIKGQWDNSAKTLKKFEIPHTRISSGDLNNRDLSGTRVVIVDCAGELDQRGRQKLRDFVARGGYLLSTDWALDNFVSITFNEYVAWNKATNSKAVYDALVVDADPVLLNHTVTSAPWKLDRESHLIRVVNRDAVRVLILSKQLSVEDPGRLGALAVLFPFGNGYVLHMLGHFDNNSAIPFGHRLPDPAPVINISLRQALAINFVVAGLSGSRISTRHSR